MIKARIEIRGLKETQDEFRDINANQIPFATAKSLTMTAQDGQSVIQNKVLGERFTLRQPGFMKKGIRITAATKHLLQATVGDIHQFMELQQEGGNKIPYKEFICVPIIGGARRSLSSNIRDEDKPHEIMQNGGFIRNGVMYRRGATYKRPRKYVKSFGPGAAVVGIARAKITAMYVLVKSAHVKERYGFIEAIAAVVQANFGNNFAKAFADAVRTAKK